METSNRGFLLISEPSFIKKLQRNAIPLYSIHNPLDVHEELSTSKSLAYEVGLSKIERFCKTQAGYNGVCGSLISSIELEFFC